MVGFGPTLAFVLLTAPSTVVAAAAPGRVRAAATLVPTNGGAGTSIAHGRRSFAFAHHQAKECNSGCPTTQKPSAGNYERSPSSIGISSKVDALQTLALGVRGGGGGSSEEASVMTLFIRVLLPGFRRGRNKDGELDLEGGGLMRRLKRLASGVLRAVRGSPASAGAEGGAEKTNAKKGKGAATASHLEKTYRPGNANYRIQKELKEFMANPPDCCKVSVGKNIRVWIITINGAEGTIYAGEKFRLRVAFPQDYPTKPPAVYFLQSPPPPKHQHIYTNGDICLSLLSARDWKPNLTVMSLALSILSMLSSAKEKRSPEDNAAHAEAKPGQAQEWIYHDDLC
eukprot:g10073.t1